MILPAGTAVPYIIGVPSVKAVILGVTGGDYLLRQEYDRINEQGEWEHVIKEYQREIWFINSYQADVV